MNDAPAPLSESNHPRMWKQNTYVYPVLSRRAGGVSVGVNLNPDKACNFDCIYCQVDRTKTPQEYFVGLPKLLQELELVLRGLLPGGELWPQPEFISIPPDKKRVNDIAFSGDGEPTTFKNFSEVIERCAEVKRTLNFDAVKMVLITNATGLDRPDVKRGLDLMDANNGEIWAKLDAGTPEYFKLIDNTDFPFAKVLDNIAACAKARPIVIQSCFMKVRGVAPSEPEISAYIARLKEIAARGGRIKLVQIYTVARNPAYSIVSSLSDAEVDAIAARVRKEAGLQASAFYGSVGEGRGIMGESPVAR
ncbi:MAG TPA: radical SAM protein [Planctomycetota bacterium]|nr:radical SAM protein [Planctomycetota bacterium]